jgi:ribosomal protein S18 acetylase RimI-like enzyme
VDELDERSVLASPTGRGLYGRRLAPASTVRVVPTIEIATAATPELVDAFARLVPQLSSSAPPLTAAELDEIARSPATVLFIARDGGTIVGTLTLVLFRIPTGLRAWIDDVVVDADARGTGVGEELNRAALAEAERRGARTVDLTSRPSREAANRLYQRLGFVRRETNVYRFTIR